MSGAARATTFDPETWLAALDRLGWRFGLERIRRLCDLLGMPQRRFAAIHVVGSNGKSSVAQMIAALLEEHGVTTGTYLSPHLERWSERIHLCGREIEPDAFAAACERTAAAVATLDRALAGGNGPDPDGEVDRGRPSAEGAPVPEGRPDRVTQFEAATAAAFQAFATARVEAAVVEAGLGGRLDATNVIPSKVTVLTSVSLEHTDLLGETEEEIAAEKLAVLRDHSTLVIGQVGDQVAKLAEAAARDRSAQSIRAPCADRSAEVDTEAPEVRGITGQGRTDALTGIGSTVPVAPGATEPSVPDVVVGTYQRRNFAVAMAAAEAFLGRPLDGAAVERAAGSARLPARLELIPGDPPLILDAAHNAAGMEALADSLAELAGGRPVTAVLAALADKDPASLVAPLARACETIVCTEIPTQALEGVGRPGARSHPAGTLETAARVAGGRAEQVPAANRALQRARALASAGGGVVLVTGSFYLVGRARG